MDATSSPADLIWFNGQFMPARDARVDVEDRGFQFADGVYEVMRVYDGRAFALADHLSRLRGSCGGIELDLGLDNAALRDGFAGLIARTGLVDGMIYLQATRGVAPRNHAFNHGTPATVLFYARKLPPPSEPGGAGIKVISLPDERWRRCWVKSIALLPNILAKTAAARSGADEAILLENGLAYEGATSNLFVVRAGRLVTAPPGPKVLPGITRLILLRLAAELGIDVEHRPPTETEARSADEVFIASTTREVAWVRQWNERLVADGRIGPITLRLHRAFRNYVLTRQDQHATAQPVFALV